jgi:hypothetical protein
MEMKMPNCRNDANRRRTSEAITLAILTLLILTGCGKKQLPTAPVEGKVLYQGKSLTFGGVLFQPDDGPLARGKIEPDGTFRLSTYRDGDGAVLGKHRVQIACYETQRPEAKGQDAVERGLGKPLIPRKYLRLDTSGLQAEVKEHNEPIVFELTPEHDRQQ